MITKLKNNYCIVHTNASGSFAGLMKHRLGSKVELSDARDVSRLAGATTLLQLAVSGTARPNDCKFPAPIDKIFLTDVCKIIPRSEEHTSELQSHSFISYAVFCLKNKAKPT